MAAHISQVLSQNPPEDIATFIETADVIVVERVLVGSVVSKVGVWRRAGKKVVATFDDAYHLISPHGDSGKFWRAKKTDDASGNFKEFRATLRAFDRVIVPSHILAQDYAPHCQDVKYVANYTMPELWAGVKKRPPDNNIVIGWGGSSGHVQSWTSSGIITALARLAQKYPRIIVRIYGGGTEIPDLLKKAGVRCEFSGWVKFEMWPQHVAMVDIGVAPLHGEYDKRRSNIKALENAMAKVPWVATDDAPYQGAVGGILVRNKPTDWEHALDGLISDSLGRSQLVADGHKWATEHTQQCVRAYEHALQSWS